MSRAQLRWSQLGLLAMVVIAATAVFLTTNTPQQARGEQPQARATAGFQDKDKLLLTIHLPPSSEGRERGQLILELLADGKILQKSEREVKLAAEGSSEGFELPAPKNADQVTVRCTLDRKQFEVPLQRILLLKPHETALSASQELFAGSTTAIRCEVHGVRSLSETIPLPHSSIQVAFKDRTGKVVSRCEGQTGSTGSAALQVPVPKLPAGDYKLEVVTRSPLGQETLERDIKVKSAPRILLTSDKPLYQPGQTIHLRALALQAHDLTPAGNSPITFEVEDGKSNKVFKKQLTTSEHGIASVDFVLASEVNQGEYQIRAQLGEVESSKTVTVKPYVLPRFKTEVKADKRFYAPKETISADVQVDYIFGKPVAGGQVEVKASTFDVAFKDFATWKGKTDARGHARVEVKLPDSFVGQPLDKGNALVRLEIKVTDTADHSEVINKTYPVSSQPVQLSLIPEGGRLVPNMENRVFVAAIYPDGTPARADVSLWLGGKVPAGQGPALGKPLAELKTAETGLAEFKFTPKPENFRQAEWVQRQVEMLGGRTHPVGMPKQVLDLTARAVDGKGHKAQAIAHLTSEPLGENVILRLDKAVYKGGEAVQVKVHTSGGLPTVYLDIVRGGQTMLTRWLDVKDSVAEQTLQLPASLFGTLEVHAYQVLTSGEVVRDSRVIYVNPAADLKIEVKADRGEYRPGEKGQIQFTVTDAQGKPAPAALGVLIVDEAVYALQEMQPGLEKVYFTLQEELLKPKAEILYRPSTNLDVLVRQAELEAQQQQIAEVLLTSARPKVPVRWEVQPALERQQKLNELMSAVGPALLQYAQANAFLVQEKSEWRFAPGLLKNAIQGYGLNEAGLKDPLGGKLDLERLGRLIPEVSPANLGQVVTRVRLQQVHILLAQRIEAKKKEWLKEGKPTIIEAAMFADIKKNWRLSDSWFTDAWGQPFRLVQRDKNPVQAITGNYELVSVGPDGKLGTGDDLTFTQHDPLGWHAWWLTPERRAELARNQPPRLMRGQWVDEGLMMNHFRLAGGAGGPLMPRAPAALPGARPVPTVKDAGIDPEKKKDGAGAPQSDVPAGAPSARLREYFPETMLWKPALITDDRGRASLPLEFADSITTWRLTASASSRSGLLGGVTTPLRVFQDFFVEIDLPVALTRHDEVAFPVAVYNYLKEPQTVKLELQPEEWFELTDGLGLTRSLDVKPGEVVGVKFRIRAKQIGSLPLTVKATGSKMSDAVKRSVEVVPEGKRIEQVFSDRLTGTVRQTITIPEGALPDASKMLVKVYPGVFAQLLEGMEGMLQMPGGCFEQTSSSAYPNILVVDYIKKTKQTNPAMLMKAEAYLSAGYQRLLTFERPGGGFDWWGSGEPLVWLSAYGLQEFNDMSRVYPVDRGIINRTQKWLMQQMAPDGTWSKIGATHGETIERMGDPKMLLTSYVVWALLDSGLKTPALNKSIAYIRDNVKTQENAYILALAANALASWDAKDDATFEVLQKVLRKLQTKQQAHNQWQAISFPAGGHSLSYARGDSMTVETTALAVLAMLKSGQFPADVNKALTYLTKSKGAHGTWGSTQATILALKALIAASGGLPFKGKAEFAILVDGKQVHKGEVNESNADLLQLFDLKEHTRNSGKHEVTIEVKGQTSLMYQVVARHYEKWSEQKAEKPLLETAVEYDRTKLSTADLLKAKATLRYHGKEPTSMVMLEVGVPPGFTVDAGEFAEMVAAKKVQKFSVTSRQVILYLGDVKPGDVLSFEYTLKPKYPIRAKTPATVAYEYYTPGNRAEAKPIELEVTDKK